MYLPSRASHYHKSLDQTKLNCSKISYIKYYLDKLVTVLETAVGQFADRQLLVESSLGGDDWRVRRQREVNSWVWDQVRLELVQVHVQCAVKTQRG